MMTKTQKMKNKTWNRQNRQNKKNKKKEEQEKQTSGQTDKCNEQKTAHREEKRNMMMVTMIMDMMTMIMMTDR